MLVITSDQEREDIVASENNESHLQQLEDETAYLEVTWKFSVTGKRWLKKTVLSILLAQKKRKEAKNWVEAIEQLLNMPPDKLNKHGPSPSD